METKTPHTPVLADAAQRFLSPRAGESYLDLTAGFGGHASLILEACDNYQDSVLVDRDQAAVDFVRNRFNEHDELPVLHQDMVTATAQLLEAGRQFDMILIDAGVSSPQLDRSERGFSFSRDGPLDMRMDQRQELKAEQIVNSYSPQQLIDIVSRYGEEPQAKQIVRAIVSARPLSTTSELAEVVKASVRPRRRHGKTHPATQTFQALRIAVNQELEQLEQAVEQAIDLLAPAGRICLISFHSLEDRIFKRQLRKRAGGRLDSELRLLTKSPVIDTTSYNPRARSAKLRAAVKIKTKRSDHANSG